MGCDFLEELKEELEEVTEKELNSEEINNNDNIVDPVNCLALTVVKEYKITVFKNVFKKGFKLTWKIALSIITMNFLNTFL